MIVCQENLYHTYKLQKQVYDKSVKPRSYAFNVKVWLNSKYIKIKCKRKLEVKFIMPFRVLHFVESKYII